VSESVETPWKKRRKRETRFAEKKEAVLAAAARLFNQKGFVSTPLSDLAELLNVTKPTLYYYVNSKDELLLEITRTGQAAYLEAVEQANENGSTGMEKLQIFIRNYIGSNCTDFGRVVVKTGRQSLSPKSQKEMDAEYRKLDTLLRHIIQEGMDDGSIAAVDPKMATFMLFGAMNWIAYWYEDSGPFSPDEVARQFIAMLTSGLAPRTTK
jgi:AcrR family transcriptional regulator